MRLCMYCAVVVLFASPVYAEPMLMIPEAQARAMLQGVATLKQEHSVLRQAKEDRDRLIATQRELTQQQEKLIEKHEELDRLKDEQLALLAQQRADEERLGWWKAAGGAVLTAAGFLVFSLVK